MKRGVCVDCAEYCWSGWKNTVLSCCNCHKYDCFPSAGKVKLENGKVVQMSELQVGDKVQTGNNFRKV